MPLTHLLTLTLTYTHPVCGEGIDEHHAQDAQQVTHAALQRLDMDGRELGETQQLWRRGGAV